MKTRSFSIFLLKEGYNPNNSLKLNHNLESVFEAGGLPGGATLYIADNIEVTPWWVNYFDIQGNLTQKSKGALVFLPVEDRYFVFTFGHVYQNLLNTSYEYDFGLKVTLNSLDPKELKSADVVAPGAARRKRTQLPEFKDLTYFDFDSNSEILKSLTGKVKEEYKELFKNATGSISLKLGLKIQPNDLLELCESLLELYHSDEYLKSFPNIQKIVPEKDPVKIAKLNDTLLNAFKNKSQELTLSIPEIIDYRDNIFCSFSGMKGIQKIYSEISLNNFYDYLGDDNIDDLTFDALKIYSVNLCDEDGKITSSFSIYRSFIFDTHFEENNFFYHLCGGEWYRIDTDYLNNLQASIDAICEDTDLIAYNHDIERDNNFSYSEENYNRAAVNGKENTVCLDQRNISPDGNSQVEPCDIFTFDKQNTQCILYHIKISTRSAQLSHLFNQGANSIELLFLEEHSRNMLKNLISHNVNPNDLDLINQTIDNKNYKVIFGIITKKDKNLLSNNLPLFSKISLVRTIRALSLAKTKVALTFIPDNSVEKDSFTKYPQIEVIVKSDDNGKREIYPVDDQVFPTHIKIKHCPKELKEHPVGTRFKLYVNQIDTENLNYYRSGGFLHLP